jgi:hypothetical protein
MIQHNGNPAYVRDGRVYEGGVFGGDIVEAVRGNPEAEEHAHAYKNGMIGGFVAVLGGGVSMGAGIAFLALGTANHSLGSGGSTEQTTGGLLFAGGLGAYITGLVLMLNAQPRMWDAINVYNDGLPMWAPPPYGYPPPPGYVYPAAPSAPPPPVPPANAAPPPTR